MVKRGLSLRLIDLFLSSAFQLLALCSAKWQNDCELQSRKVAEGNCHGLITASCLTESFGRGKGNVNQ
jgi:hypothetical protein